MLARSILFAWLMAASNLYGAVVVNDNNLTWGPGSISSPFPGVPNANYAATIFQDAVATDYTSAWFYYDGSSIRGINENLDEGSAWYVVAAGQPFSRQTIQNGLSAPLISLGPNFHAPVSVSFGEDIYLGVNSGQGFVDSDVFGWVLLRPTGGAPGVFPPVLTMVDNAISYGSQGIVVGTNTLVPEPAMTVLAALGITFFFVCVGRCFAPMGR